MSSGRCADRVPIQTPLPITYGAKAAITHTAVFWALELTLQLMRISIIEPPGSIRPENATSTRKSQSPREASASARKAGKPEEVANAVAFLASSSVSYITGATIYGGFFLKY